LGRAHFLIGVHFLNVPVSCDPLVLWLAPAPQEESLRRAHAAAAHYQAGIDALKLNQRYGLNHLQTLMVARELAVLAFERLRDPTLAEPLLKRVVQGFASRQAPRWDGGEGGRGEERGREADAASRDSGAIMKTTGRRRKLDSLSFYLLSRTRSLPPFPQNK
jgi:hypothetical protein